MADQPNPYWGRALPEPLPPLVEDILPTREVSILAGASGAGKTTLLLHLIKAFQTNSPFFGKRVRPNTRIGFIAADRTWRSYAERIRKIGVDTEKLGVRTVADDEDIDESRLKRDAMGLLFDLIRSLGPLDLVIIDPMVHFFGASPKEWHLMGPALLSLNKWCNRQEMTVLGTHHSTKARTDFSFVRPQDRINGSMGLLGFSSSQLFMMEPEGDADYHQLFVHGHNAADWHLKLRMTDQGIFVPVDEDGLDGLTAEGQPDPLSRRILAILPPTGSGLSVGREFIVHALKGFASPPTVDRRLKLILREGWATKAGRGEYQRTA